MNRLRTLPFHAALLGGFIFSIARAQDALPGVPAEYQATLTAAIGLLSGLLVYPLTALAKRFWKTSGVNTVVISAVLSLLVAAGFNVWQAVATQGSVPIWTALITALWAFVQANGAYIAKVYATAKAGTVFPVDGETLPLDKTGEGQAAALEYMTGTAQPFLGLPDLGAVAGGLLGSPLMDGLVKALLTAAGLPAGAAQVLQVGMKLAPIAPDLLDGNPQLSTENLAKINRVILDLKAEYLK